MGKVSSLSKLYDVNTYRDMEVTLPTFFMLTLRRRYWSGSCAAAWTLGKEPLGASCIWGCPCPKSVWAVMVQIVDKHKLYVRNGIQSSPLGCDITSGGKMTPTFLRKSGFCFAQLCCWRFKSCAVQCCVIGWLIANVSEDRSPFQMSGTMRTTTQHHTKEDCMFVPGEHTAFIVRI
jgi:hypothetical protein